MRTLILMGCGIVVAGLSGCALGASRIYTNEMYCFSALKPTGMNISTLRAGAEFDFGKSCGILGDPTNNCILVYGKPFFTNADPYADPYHDPLAEETHTYELKGFVLKPDGGFGRVKGWRQQTLFKGTGDQQQEVHIYARTVPVIEPIVIGYEIVAEFNSSQRKTFSKSVLEVLTTWRMIGGCKPLQQSASETPGGGL